MRNTIIVGMLLVGLFAVGSNINAERTQQEYEYLIVKYKGMIYTPKKANKQVNGYALSGWKLIEVDPEGQKTFYFERKIR